MGLFRRHRHDDNAEVPCPRCKTPVPAGDMECNVCGWDMREQYRGDEEELTRGQRHGMLDG